jgi:hypothetical protein
MLAELASASAWVRVRRRFSFNRIMTPRFTTDAQQLTTYRMDIMKVLSENSVKV